MGTSHRAVQLSGPRSSIISEKSRSSSTTTMGKGNNEGGFSQEQIDMYKECFKLMDVDKDGTLSKNDLRAAFDNVGKLMDESELDSMLGEVGGSCTFDAMVKMFQEKIAGGGEEKKEEEPAKEEAPPAEEEAAPADDGGKKKKKKKKAAKQNVLSQMSQFVTMQQRMPPA